MKFNLYRKLSSTFLRKWWLLISVAICILIVAVLFTSCFNIMYQLIINHEVILRKDSKTFSWWAKPPVEPMITIYIYNVTNADYFLSNGSKPELDEIGPYVYTETWERKNIVFHDNGTISFNQQKIYIFDAERSVGSEEDVVVVPNIPMLSATSQSKHATRFLRLAMASIMDVLKVKPFVEVTVGQLLWGYEDPLLKLAKEVIAQDQKLPYEEFGLMYNKNGTSKDTTTIFSGATDIRKYGLIDRFNGNSSLTYWKTDSCNRLNGSDGSIFPPHITKETTLYVYDKDLCRLLPLVFDKEVEASGGVPAYRFTPPKNVFENPALTPENDCFCPHGPPCNPNGLLNVSLCQYDSPVVLSFPHFYLADDSYRDAVEGVSEPDPSKHRFEIDVQPLMGTTMRARARMQINLAVTKVEDIKQVATFPDIVFPIMWFEEGIDGLPLEVTRLMRLATVAQSLINSIVSSILFLVGGLIFIVASWKLVRGANRNRTLPLNTPGSFYMSNKEITNCKQWNIKIFRDVQMEDNNLLCWRALIVPENPPYNRGAFRIEINFPPEYPFKPPKILFKTKIYHPNIDDKGQVCLPIISAENWKPATQTVQVIESLIALIETPEPEHPLRADIADEYVKDRKKFGKNADEFTKKYAEKRPVD